MSQCSSRRGFTLIELLVVIAIIAILVALLLPAVQQVREAARKSQCQDHLHNIGIAIHNYEGAHKRIPPGSITTVSATTSTTWCTSGGSFQYAPWTVLILPFIEQKPLYDQMNLNVPFVDSGNNLVNPNLTVVNNAGKGLDIYQCPSDPDMLLNPQYASYMGVQGGAPNQHLPTPPAPINCQNTGCTPTDARAHWVNGMLYSGSNLNLAAVLDGTSNVFMLGESRYSDGYWATSGKLDSCTGPRNLAGALEPINSRATRGLVYSSKGFSSRHAGGCHFAMGDNVVSFVSDNIDLYVYQQLAQRADSLPVGGRRN